MVFALNYPHVFNKTKKPNTLTSSESVSPHYHHLHVVPHARIFLTLSRHFSLSFVASGRYSGLHPVSGNSCCMYARAGRPAFARPYVGVHRSKSLMSSSLLLQQCAAYLLRFMNINPLPLTSIDNKQKIKRSQWHLIPIPQISLRQCNKSSAIFPWG